MSCYLIADVKPGKVLHTSVKALTSFADLCQTSGSWTECCSVEDKNRKCQHIVLSILVSVVGFKIVDDCPLNVMDSNKVNFIYWIVSYIVCKQTFEMVIFWHSKASV